jgi:enamine deaminase RidA (YjgF/YER057c/UK114 family)
MPRPAIAASMASAACVNRGPSASLMPSILGAVFSPYSQIVHAKTREIVFVASQVATREDGSIAGADDFEAQCEQVYRNIETALAHVGANWSNVAQFTSCLISADDIEPYKA